MTDSPDCGDNRAVSSDETTYKAFFDNATIAMILINEQTTIVTCNAMFEKLLGYPKAEIEGVMSWTSFVADPDELARMRRYHERRRERQDSAPAAYNFDMIDRLGRRKTISVNITMIPETKNSLAFLQDITQKNKTESALKESEKWYRAIFENTGLPSIIIDRKTTIIMANTAWARLSGYPIEETEGMKSWTEFVAKDDLERMKAYHEHRRDDNASAPRRYEFDYIRRNGEIRRMINSVTMIPGTEYSLASMLDITDLKEKENEAKKLEQQLAQASRLESIGLLAGGIAHDFNNMLGSILGFAQLIKLDAGDNASLHEMADEIIKATGRAGELTRQLLAFARRQTLEMKALDLNSVVSNFERMLRRTIKENVEIRLVLEPDLPAIEADAGQIEQIILNLAVNAEYAMPTGGLLVIETGTTVIDDTDAGLRETIAPGRYAVLSISDTGCGMDKATIEKIFDPFFTTKDVGRGTGLGLAMTYGIVKQHNGGISVYSEPGNGTVFRIFLPQTEKSGEVRREEPHAVPLTGTETILLVEDQEQLRRTTRLLLQQLGYHVLDAADGGSACELLDNLKGPLDLLITDVIMPGMNGKQLHAEIRKRHPETRVLYVSGYPREIIGTHGYLEEGVEFLAKPVARDILAGRIRAILDREPDPD